MSEYFIVVMYSFMTSITDDIWFGIDSVWTSLADAQQYVRHHSNRYVPHNVHDTYMQIYDQNSNLIDNYTALQNIADLNTKYKYECVYLHNANIKYHITDNDELKIDNIYINYNDNCNCNCNDSVPIFTRILLPPAPAIN